MNDPIIESIMRGHQEEIEAELHEKRMKRLPDEVLGTLDRILDHAIEANTRFETVVERLETINQNIYELHNTQKDIRTYAKYAAIGAIFAALGVIKLTWF